MLRRTLLSLVCAASLAGCAAKPAAHLSAKDQKQPLRLAAAPRVAAGDRADMQIVGGSDVDVVMQLDVYQLTVPLGAISRSDQFWRHVDEDHVDLAAHHLLQMNGLRFGISPNAEWDYFKNLMDKYGASAQKGSVAPVKRGSLELPLRTNVDQQDIFYFNAQGALYGRTYDRCDNCLSLTYEPIPRRPGDARIEACAIVRGVRKQFEVSVLNEARDIQFKRPEYLYDLRLRQDVPMDHFLILAPSALVELPDNLGHALLVRPGLAEPTETVLLLVPRPFRLSNAPQPPATPTAKRPTDNGGRSESQPPPGPQFPQMPKMKS